MALRLNDSQMTSPQHPQRIVTKPSPPFAKQRSPLPPIQSPLSCNTPLTFAFPISEETGNVLDNTLATFKAPAEDEHNDNDSLDDKIAALRSLVGALADGFYISDIPRYVELVDLGVDALQSRTLQQAPTAQQRQYTSALRDIIILAGTPAKPRKASDVLQTAPHVSLIRALAGVVVRAPSPMIQAAAASAIGFYIECDSGKSQGKDVHAKAKARNELIVTEAGIAGLFVLSITVSAVAIDL